jgi:CubicO group peptidase (beta-lactamase class C family)
MLRFLQMNLRPEGQPLAEALQATQTVRHRRGSGPTLALGWHVVPSAAGTPLYWHNGGTGGFRSFAGFVQGGSVAVVVLANSALPLQLFNQVAFQIMRAALDANS